MVVQLYIQGQRVELFGDETISITDTIQDVRDIEKVFTSFSQSFSVPASKTNNKIFKHYYNSEITNTFDGRKKVSATIEIDYFPFKKGKLRLEGVDMRGNKAYAYRVTFFGDTVELKDKIGEDKLADLNFNAYQPLYYDEPTVRTKFTTAQSSTNHIIVPLITHTQRLFYNSDGSEEEADDGNLKYFSGGGSHHHGVKWNELKYAIRVNKIIEAIESKYSIQFSSDFFKNTSNDDFNNLFLWLHRKSGPVENLSGSTSTLETIIDGWTPVTVSKSGEPYSFVLTETTLTSNVPTFGLTSGTTPSAPTARGLTEFKVQLSTTDVDDYDVVLLRDGVTVFSKTNQNGPITISADPSDTNTFTYAPGSYQVVITAQSTISFSNIIWFADYKVPKSTDITLDATNGATGAYNTNSSFTFNVDKQMPDMKVIDFITGLFKLFNLTAYVEDDIIQVKTLDSFYSIAGGAKTYDITEFVDANQSSVDVALPFKEVIFKFKDTDSFLAHKFNELNGFTWGEDNYNQGPDLSESEYKVEAPFGHMLFERLTDISTAGGNEGEKDIQWGYSVDKDQNPYLGNALLFYPVFTSTGGISFVRAVDDDNVATDHINLASVNLPSNSVSFNPATNNSQLNFAAERNEWTKTSEFTDSLFVKYYKSYIEQVFSPANRIVKIKAYLPLKILLKYTLADKFVYRNERYQINSITTNLQTGESEIELLNVVII